MEEENSDSSEEAQLPAKTALPIPLTILAMLQTPLILRKKKNQAIIIEPSTNL